MRIIMLVLIVPCLFAGEFDKVAVEAAAKAKVQIEIDRGEIISQPAAVPGEVVQIFPEDCESKMYRWNGEDLACITVDRSGILKAHRNLNMNAYRKCMGEVVFLKNKAVVHAIHDDAREKCREFGKLFDVDTVQCTGSITGGITK